MEINHNLNVPFITLLRQSAVQCGRIMLWGCSILHTIACTTQVIEKCFYFDNKKLVSIYKMQSLKSLLIKIQKNKVTAFKYIVFRNQLTHSSKQSLVSQYEGHQSLLYSTNSEGVSIFKKWDQICNMLNSSTKSEYNVVGDLRFPNSKIQSL